ncbi:MAG: PQQ-binding-like beta-propeller repeat protein [Asticcacaulis sp.]
MKKLLVAATTCILLSSCGGGGGGGGGSAPTAPPSLSLQLSSTSGSASVLDGNTQTLTTSATVTEQNGSLPYVVDVQYDSAVFASVSATAGTTPGTYTVAAQTRPDLLVGDYKGTITARLCKEVACATVYTSATYAYDINVRLQDWQTFQRNAAHTGRVHVKLDPSRFAKAWEWTISTNANNGLTYGINGLTTIGGNVIVTRNNTFNSNGTVYALNEATGAQVWSTDIPGIATEGAAAAANGKIYVPAIGPTQNNAVYVFDSATGNYLFKSIFYAQWTVPGAPTPYGDQFYLAAGSYGGQISSHAQTSDEVKWRTMSVGAPSASLQSVAVDDQSVYYHTGGTLNIFNRVTGVLTTSIQDASDSSGYDYGAPVLTSKNSVISLSGTGYYTRYVTLIDTVTKARLWRSAIPYSAQPAYAKNLIFTAKDTPARLDVLKESDGTIAWSWVPPIADSRFASNIIVTDNLLFVSTDKAVYAIDLTTHQSVWSYPASGNLILSPGYKLYIQSTAISTIPRTGPSITAISLQ